MKTIALGLLLITASAGSVSGRPFQTLAQAAPGNSPNANGIAPQTQEKCVLEGVVLNASTGQPVKKAEVSLQRTDTPPGVIQQIGMSNTQRQARTDSSGRFVFPSLDAGTYNLWASRNGYLGRAYGQESQDDPMKLLELKAGDHKSDVVFRLMPTGVIAGHVYDEDGEPLAGANVQAMEWRYVNGRRELQNVSGCSSNDMGEYRLTGLQARKYYVAAIYNDWNQSLPSDDPPATYVPIYYPGSVEPSGAQPIDVRAGEETPAVDLSLSPIPAVRVSGRITGHVPSSRPGVGWNVTLVQSEGGANFYHQALTNPADGTFQILNVPPGSYVVLAQLFDGANNYSGKQKVDVGGSNLDGLNVVVGPGAVIHGFVRSEGNLDLNLKGMQVSLNPRDASQGGVQPATVEADGGFTLKQVPDGSYDVNLCCLPAPDYLKAAHLGSEEALDNGLNVKQAGLPGTLELVISGAGGEVSGAAMHDHKAFPNATVVLVPDPTHRDRTRLYKIGNSGQDGGFSFDGIPPGDYELFAWDKVEYGAYQDPDFLLPLEDQATPARVIAGAKLKVEVQVISRHTQ